MHQYTSELRADELGTSQNHIIFANIFLTFTYCSNILLFYIFDLLPILPFLKIHNARSSTLRYFTI
jgi:hypothetical protein